MPPVAIVIKFIPEKVELSGPVPPNDNPLVLSDAPEFCLIACRMSPKSNEPPSDATVTALMSAM